MTAFDPAAKVVAEQMEGMTERAQYAAAADELQEGQQHDCVGETGQSFHLRHRTALMRRVNPGGRLPSRPTKSISTCFAQQQPRQSAGAHYLLLKPAIPAV